MGSVIVGLLGIGYVIYKKIRKNKLLKEFGDLDTITNKDKGNIDNPDITGSADVVLGTNFDPAPVVADLHRSMKGWGTTDWLLNDTIYSLSCEEMEIVKDFWDSKYTDSLREWVIDDTSGNQRTQLLDRIDGTHC